MQDPNVLGGTAVPSLSEAIAERLLDCLKDMRWATEVISSVDVNEIQPGVFRLKAWPRNGRPELFAIRVTPWRS